MPFLGIITWKGVSHFDKGGGSDGGDFIFKWGEGVPHGGHWF